MTTTKTTTKKTTLPKHPPVPIGRRWSELSWGEKEAFLTWNPTLALEAKAADAIIRPAQTATPAGAPPVARRRVVDVAKPATKTATKTKARTPKIHRGESATSASGVRATWASMTAAERASVEAFDPTLAAKMASKPAWAWRLRPEALA